MNFYTLRPEYRMAKNRYDVTIPVPRVWDVAGQLWWRRNARLLEKTILDHSGEMNDRSLFSVGLYVHDIK